MFKSIKGMIYQDTSTGWHDFYNWQTCPKCGCRSVTPIWHAAADLEPARGERKILGAYDGEHMHLRCNYLQGGNCGYEWAVPPRYFTEIQLREFGLDQ